MNLSTGQKRAILFLIFFIILWKFWTDAEGLASWVQGLFYGIGQVGDRLSRFMGAF